MKYFFCLFFIFSTIIYAQEKNYHSAQDDLVAGESYFIYNNEVTIFKKPDDQSRVLDSLSPGDAVEFVDKTTVVSGTKSNKGVFIKIETTNGKIGYISSTELSLGRFTAADGSMILYQQQQHPEDLLLHFKNIKSDGIIIDLGAFDKEYPEFYISIENNRGLSRVDHILRLDFIKHGCGAPQLTRYLSLNLGKSELLYFALLKNDCPSENVKRQHKLIFPDEKDGMKDVVVYSSSKKVLVNEKFQEYKTYVYTRVHKWAGGTLLRPVDVYDW